MKIRDVVTLASAFVMVGAVVTAAVIPGYRIPPEQIELSGKHTVTCPIGDSALGETTVTLADAQSFSANQLGEVASDPAPLLTFTDPGKVVVAQGTPLLGGISLSTQSGHTSAAACATPVSYGAWDGLSIVDQEARLVMTNVDDAPAVVDLFLYGMIGQIKTPGLTDITVGAHSTEMLEIGRLTVTDSLVTVVMRVSQGRVSALMRITDDQGSDWGLPQSTPSDDLVIAGIPPGAGTRTLAITNAQNSNASVLIQVIGEEGLYAPFGASRIPVDSMTVVSVDVTQALSGMAGTIIIESDQVVTAAVTARDADTAFIPAGSALGEAIAFPATGGTLFMTNVESHEVTVTVQTDDGMGHQGRQDVTIPPQTVQRMDFATAGRVVLLAQEAQTIHAAVVLSDTHLAVIPLVSGGLATSANSPRVDPALG